MDDFSLIQEALDCMKRKRIGQLNLNDISIDDDYNDEIRDSSMNTLEVNMFVLEEHDQCLFLNSKVQLTERQRMSLLQNLARVGKRANELLKDWNQRSCTTNRQWNSASPFVWNSGGDGPVFGVHINTNMEKDHVSSPFLRATCHYGDSVYDEFLFIALMFHLTEILNKEFPSHLIAVEALDKEDGQILLIEGADYIPTDSLCTPENSRNRLWIIQGELFLLLEEENLPSSSILHRNDAILCLVEHFISSQTNRKISTSKAAVTYAPEEMKQTILRRVYNLYESTTIVDPSFCYDTTTTIALWNFPSRVISKQSMHYAPCVVPFNLAAAIRLRSDLNPCAIDCFCSLIDQYEREQVQSLSNKHNINKSSKRFVLPVGQTLPYTNLVVAVIPFSKARYAMLMSACGDSKLVDSSMMPHFYRTVEAVRLRRLLSSDDNEHLHDAMEAGVRLTLGYEWLSYVEHLQELARREENNHGSVPPMGDVERRLLKYWATIDKALGGNGEWIYNYWKDGPNSNNHILSPLVGCPVYRYEIQNVKCPLSFCNSSLNDQICNLFKKAEKNISFQFPLPTKEMVDNDAWRSVSTEMFEKLMINATAFGNDPPAKSKSRTACHNSYNQKDIKGNNSKPPVPTQNLPPPSKIVTLDSDALVDIIMQTTGTGPELKYCKQKDEDSFFSDGEDSSDSSDSSEVSSSEDENDEVAPALSIHDIMKQMDEELEATGVRKSSVSTSTTGRSTMKEEGFSNPASGNIIDDMVKINPQVLSRLLKSLESETGEETGPVLAEMLRAMGGGDPQPP